ncbi:Uncharacterized protein APZ42_023432 [Daphnia magna]|uniref:Uncharacterized protein n=1 Tax=Daphnia magna TaxID=35525 RepID=A0A164UYP6_9CRUS|nr:Uncharacterized protein APZ42_023432 [Daphnia magna]
MRCFLYTHLVIILTLQHTRIVIYQLTNDSDVLTLLTATADDVLQEGVLRGHEAPPSSRHHYLDTVNFRNFGGYTGRPDQQNATMVGVLTKGKIKKKMGIAPEKELKDVSATQSLRPK